MNKSGHIALAMGLGSIYLLRFTMPVTPWDLFPAAVMMGGVAVGALAPDIDHKTSTASKLITPFPAKLRRMLRQWGWLLQLVGAICMLLKWGGSRLPEAFTDPSWAQFLVSKLLPAGPLIWGAGLLMVLLARLRDVILLGAGAWLIGAYALYHLHWFVAFAGAALMIVPIVKHRGIIHTPEFALAFTLGGISLVAGGMWYITAAMTGFLLGWWLHLAGDLFGEEGIHSLIIPKLRVALHLFRNGGTAERWISRISWVVAIGCWLMVLQHIRTEFLVSG